MQMERKPSIKRIVTVMLTFALVFGVTACGNNGEQTESRQDATEQIEDHSAEDNILIAYFSRVGNMNFDENIDAVTSASVNMDGSNVSGNAQLLAEMAQKVTGGERFRNRYLLS